MIFLRSRAMRAARLSASMGDRAAISVAAICVLIALGAFACGSDSGDENGTTAGRTETASSAPAELTAYLITARDLSRTRPGTPERSLLRWWQAMQYSSFDEAYDLLAPSLKRRYSLKQFEREARLATIGGFFSKPDLVERRGRGSNSTLLVNLLVYKKDKVTGVAPTVFHMQMVDDRWHLADLRYFERKADEGRAADG
jgi:hypothetical protein